MDDKYLWSLVYTIFTIPMEDSLYLTFVNKNQLYSIKIVLFLFILDKINLTMIECF